MDRPQNSNIDIIRTYPPLKIDNIKQKRLLEYPIQTDVNELNKLRRVYEDSNSIRDYNKWLKGINYTTVSNNVIKIGGDLHNRIGKKFYIKHVSHVSLNINRYKYKYEKLLFTDVNKINWKVYFSKVKTVKDIIDSINIKKKENEYKATKKQLELHNNEVYDVTEKIMKLKEWDDFVVYDGKNMDYHLFYMMYIERITVME